ncbi:MAG: methyl-accepting chemotaxis protein, partial [Comamonadaceae bacterium]|nr:methyl-accepting chemotaxis protein [Comamonadaceae bacterium]
MVSEIQNGLAQVRILEKDMLIQYEQPEQLKKTHAAWLESIQNVKKAGETFNQGAPEKDTEVVQGLLQHLERYQELFTPVARQLLA